MYTKIEFKNEKKNRTTDLNVFFCIPVGLFADGEPPCWRSLSYLSRVILMTTTDVNLEMFGS